MNQTLLFSVLLLMVSAPAFAGVGKLSSPGGVPKGQLELEYGGVRTGDDHGSSRNNAQMHVIEAEYGIGDRWVLGLEYEVERESPQSLSGVGIQPKAQYEMTSQDEWWLASAVKIEYLIARGADEAGAKLLLQRKDGPAKLLANLGVKRGIGSGRDSSVAFDSKLQGTWHISDFASPGIEWHADFGRANQLTVDDTMGQYVGPIVTGKLFELADREFSYVLGYYRGLTSASAEDAARIELEYQFVF